MEDVYLDIWLLHHLGPLGTYVEAPLAWSISTSPPLIWAHMCGSYYSHSLVHLFPWIDLIGGWTIDHFEPTFDEEWASLALFYYLYVRSCSHVFMREICDSLRKVVELPRPLFYVFLTYSWGLTHGFCWKNVVIDVSAAMMRMRI